MMVKMQWRAGLLVCVLVAPLSTAAADEGVSEKDIAYVEKGKFLKDKNFNARAFVRVLAALPALKKENSRLAKKIRKGVKKHMPKRHENILDYYSTFHSDRCVQRRVAHNIAVKSFDHFQDRTENLAGWMRGDCKDFRKGRSRNALEILDNIISRFPQDGPVFLHRAILRSRSGDASGAGADYREALKVPAKLKSSGGALSPFEMKLKEGVSLSVGECLCSDSLKVEFTKLKVNYEKSEAAKKEGITLFLEGKTQKAISRFDKAVIFDPGDAEAFLSRAVAREKFGGEVEKAFSDYQSASKLAAASGRLDMAADALLSSAKLTGLDEKTVLPGTVEGLEGLLSMASSDWNRREAVAVELKTLKLKLKKILPQPGKKKPLAPGPDGADTSIPDVGEADLAIPDTGGPEAPPVKKIEKK